MSRPIARDHARRAAEAASGALRLSPSEQARSGAVSAGAERGGDRGGGERGGERP